MGSLSVPRPPCSTPGATGKGTEDESPWPTGLMKRFPCPFLTFHWCELSHGQTPPPGRLGVWFLAMWPCIPVKLEAVGRPYY